MNEILIKELYEKMTPLLWEEADEKTRESFIHMLQEQYPDLLRAAVTDTLFK